MAKKISDLTAISGGTFSTTDLFEVSVDTGGSVFVSRKITGQEMLDSIGSSNIGNSDLTISTTGDRKLILGGALTTDSFVIRNSADSTNFFKVDGTGDVFIDGTTFQFDASANTLNMPNALLNTGTITLTTNSGIASSGGVGDTRLYSKQAPLTDGFSFGTYYARMSVGAQTTTGWGSTASNLIGIENGTAPSSNVTDMFVMYSSDATAGNACPTFRTEDGTVIQIYQETTGVGSATFTANTSGISDDTATWGGYTIGQVVQALQNLGILA